MTGTHNSAADILVRNAFCLADGIDQAPTNVDIAILGGKIDAVQPAGGPLSKRSAKDHIDARNRIVLPGFVNAHYHSYDTLSKGRFEDLPFDLWAALAQPGPWGPRTRKELRLRTLLGALECLASGITTLQDMHSLVPATPETLDTVLEAYDEVGIRCVFSLAARDLPSPDSLPWLPADTPDTVRDALTAHPVDPFEDLRFIDDQMARYPNTERLTWAITPSGPQRCSPELLAGLADIAKRDQLPVMTHAYETLAQLGQARNLNEHGSGSYLDRLEDAGLLGPRLTLAHGVYLSASEIDRLAAVGAGVVCNPLANLKLKNGVAPFVSFKQAGLRMALGCDNCSCSDCQDMFQAMKMTTLLAQGSSAMPTGFTAADALEAATRGGAIALGLDQQSVGRIEPGYAADLVMLDRTDLAFTPENNLIRQLVFCATTRSVKTVIVAGSIVFEDGRSTKVDMAALRAELAELKPQLDADFAALEERTAPLNGPLLDAQQNLATIYRDENRTVPGKAR